MSSPSRPTSLHSAWLCQGMHLHSRTACAVYAPEEEAMLEMPPPPTVVLCVRPGPSLTKVELPELPWIVPEFTA